ncbi:hypothetical protein L1987_12189 [Smallanthus sonchifolius]|uniref:Uncharacterized protein n=1 Tax=Smallanthus sonchifolius TaxID=185202 RepID=A0ACB9JEM6_9ASTR|nr:hypothetical protein L1987_12189 [Smallanthus sonchifolius]
MNTISPPYYKKDPFAILPNNNSPEYHPQSYNSSSQWMEAGSNFSNWNTNIQQLQGNNEAESSYIQQNNSTEENPSEESHQYEHASENPEDYPFNNSVSNSPDYQSYNSKTHVLYDPYMFPEPPYDGPFKEYFQAPPEYQNAYNDIMMGLRSYNITPIYSQNFHEGYADIPYENNPEKEERADSNIPYVPYYETIPIPAPHINENASGRERERMLLNRIVELEREKAESKKTGNEEYYYNSSEDESMGNNYGRIEKKRKVAGCTYKMFQDCKPYNFSRREGGIATLRWIENTESVLAINKCAEKDKVLYASNLFKDQALEWWNNIIAAKGREAAYAMGWSAFKTRVEKKYVPRMKGNR